MSKIKLEERFEQEIKERAFNLLEITGFENKPSLALKAGMAMGYSMAVDDFTELSKKLKEYEVDVTNEK